ALCAEEMETLAGDLLTGDVADAGPAREALMGAILQLRRYLERLTVSGAETRFPLLSIINELRGAHGRTEVTEAILFTPDFGAVDAREDGPPRDSGDRRVELAPRARAFFQRGLIAWLRGDAEDGLKRMARALSGMDEAAPDARRAAPWWVGCALIEALRTGSVDGNDAQVRGLLPRLERELKRLADL
ncbi:hypothetical protein, partial [Arhodomonas sp. KWT]